MRLFRSARWVLLALVLCAIPASSYAGVFISVGFAPPVLPVYVQPACPEPGLMWTPGYWAYGPDGYYWVPGAWVPAPYEGALWTPPYWGYEGAAYIFHPGYWGMHVGYYGGVNYGFGYMGIGFVGGAWRGHEFAYNTAVVHVNETIVHTTYVDRTIVQRNTIVNDRHVAFSGGPGGIRHEPTPEERIADHDRHVGPTSFQAHHEDTFRGDRTSYFKNNGGHPQTMTMNRPLAAEHAPAAAPRPAFNGGHPAPAPEARPAPQMRPAQRPEMQQRPAPQTQRPEMQQRPAPQAQPRSAQPQPRQESRPAPQASHPAPQARPESRPQQESRQRPESKERGH